MSRPDHVDPEARLDRFAELLSLDLDMPTIRDRMGLKKGSAYALLAKLRKRMGPQAI